MTTIRKGNKTIYTEGSRVRVFTMNEEPSRTQQQFKDETDRNTIVAKYTKRTFDNWLSQPSNGGVFADLSKITDFKESCDKIHSAQNAFSALPAELRNRFKNDPAQLLAFLQDPKNHEEGVKLGLFNSKPEEQQITPESQRETQNAIKKGEKSKPPVSQKPSTPPQEE